MNIRWNWLERIVFWIGDYQPKAIDKFRCRCCGHMVEGLAHLVDADRERHKVECLAPGCIWPEDEQPWV